MALLLLFEVVVVVVVVVVAGADEDAAAAVEGEPCPLLVLLAELLDPVRLVEFPVVVVLVLTGGTDVAGTGG
jgi:hypothetical protein